MNFLLTNPAHVLRATIPLPLLVGDDLFILPQHLSAETTAQS